MAKFGIHGNNLAQMAEIEWSLQRAGQLLDILLEDDLTAPLQTAPVHIGGGTGTAVTEAPRGLLVHHYVVDEWGMVVSADVVTPTSINQRVMAAQIMADLAEERDHARLMVVAERIVRAFDPCISCAVHLVPVAALRGSSSGVTRSK
jgi:coenzyme F420-reducing hydrogenase alpha subunit